MGKVVFRRLRRRHKAFEEVADAIRKLILSGAVSLGDRLPSERDMAEQFGVSRVVVREAIRTLEQAGFVTVRKGARGGVFVAQDYDRPVIQVIESMIAGGDLTGDHLFAVRTLIEPYAAEVLATSGTDEDVQALREIVDEAAAEVDRQQAAGRPVNLRPYNVRFHRMVIRRSGNPLLSLFGETAMALVVDAVTAVPSTEIGRHQLDFHLRLLDAIERGDAEASRAIMLEDIEALRERYVAEREATAAPPAEAAPGRQDVAAGRVSTPSGP